MPCCLNPDCLNPHNPDGQEQCQSCGTPLIHLLRNRYRVLICLSDEGGFGRTYLAEDIDKLNEWCVVKQFAPKVQETRALKKAVALFQDEAKQLQKLGEHQQIPALLAYFEQDNYLFLVQQYIDGDNLSQELHKEVKYTEGQILEFLLDLLPVLQFIHQQGVIHRDIKPHNIIRRRSDGRLVLIDFGCSKHVTTTMQTQIGTAIGSHGYTAIEQMQEGKAYPASDLFSLGVTCFHLLTGIGPSTLWMQQGYSWVTTWREYLINSRRSGLTLGLLDEVLDKLLKIDIHHRYQSAEQVLRDLTNQPSFISESATVPPTSFTKQRPYFQNPLLLNAAVLLLGLGVIWYLQFRPQGIIESSNPSQPVKSSKENFHQPKTLKGHSSDVNSVAFAPDGVTLATGSDDKTIKLWNLPTGKEIYTLKGHTQWIWTVAFSPDGVTLASGSADKTIKLWNLATGKEIRTLKQHSQGVTSVAFSPDGRFLASGSLDKTVKLWNLATGEEIRTLSGHSQAVASVAFSPDGKTLATGSWDKTIKLWNLATGKEIRTLEGHTNIVLSVAFSPDSVNLASGSKDKTIKLWNLVTGEAIRTLKGHGDKVNSVAYVPQTENNKTVDGFTLASGSNDNTVKLWNLQTGKLIRALKTDSGYIYTVAISPDGSTIASGGSAENIIKIWRGSP